MQRDGPLKQVQLLLQVVIDGSIPPGGRCRPDKNPIVGIRPLKSCRRVPRQPYFLVQPECLTVTYRRYRRVKINLNNRF